MGVYIKILIIVHRPRRVVGSANTLILGVAVLEIYAESQRHKDVQHLRHCRLTVTIYQEFGPLGMFMEFEE